MTDKKARPPSRAERALADVQRSKDVLSEEAKRVASDVARTTKLRGLREARDAVEREAAEAEAKRVVRIKRRAKAAKGLRK
jgi:hypothetical protein